MRFITNNIMSGSVSSSGTVKSTSIHGIDSTSAEDERSISRADGISYYDGSEQPGTVNMIRTGLGQISKRPGYTICKKSEQFGTLGGVFKFSSPDKELYFFISGDVMAVSSSCYDFESEDTVTVDLPDDFDDCTAMQSEDCMFFLNGNFVFIYRIDDGEIFYIGSDGSTTVTEYTNPFEGLYLPVLFIGCTPDGAGSSYEAVNLLNPYISEQFVCDGAANEFTVHMDIKSNSTVHAFTKTSDGQWIPAAISSNTQRTVKFVMPPPATSVEGEDNLKIIYLYDSFAQNAYKIAKCRCMTMYGVAGYKDRVFLAANSDLPNMIYYSDMDNHLYFPDLNYLKVGQSDTQIVLLAGDDTRLAVICNDNIYMVSGNTQDPQTAVEFLPNALFLISGIFRTARPMGSALTEVFDNEVVYLTEKGVSAITASGVLDERYCQNRSAMINYHLQKEQLENCKMIAYDDFLVISNRSDTLYLLDSKQYFKSGSEPFSYRQYDGYIWKGVNAKYLWEHQGYLYFSDGEYIFRFNKNFVSNSDYRDEVNITDGQVVYNTINAYWETPAIYCQSFHVNKFFERMGTLLSSQMASDGALLNTDVKICAKFDNDDWRVIKDYGGELSVFRYENISYPRFTYSDRPQSYAVYKRLLHKRGRSIKLRFENNNFDQPFTLRSFLIEYTIM